MESISELLVAQLTHRQAAVEHLAQGFSAEESQQPLHAKGPSAEWILHHLGEMAHATLCALGGTAPRPASAGLWPLPRTEFHTISARLLLVAKHLAPDDWAAPPAIEVLPAFRDSLRTRHAFLSGHIFHLAYHAGQLASLRALLGVAR